MAADPVTNLAQLMTAARRHADRIRQGNPRVAPEVLVDAVTLELMHFGVDRGDAAAAALAAWSELEGERSGAHFDLAASTRDLVYIVDPVAGQRRALSATDLLRLMGPRAAAR